MFRLSFPSHRRRIDCRPRPGARLLLLRARLPSHHVCVTARLPPALTRRRPECELGGDDCEGGAGRTPESQGRGGGAKRAFIAAGRPLYDAADARHDTRRKPQIAAQNPRRPPGGGLALSKATQHSRAELKNERQLSTPPKRREKGKYQTVILEQALARKEIYETVSAPSTPSF